MGNYEWLQDVLKEMAIAASLSLVGVVTLVKITTLMVEMIRGIF